MFSSPAILSTAGIDLGIDIDIGKDIDIGIVADPDPNPYGSVSFLRTDQGCK